MPVRFRPSRLATGALITLTLLLTSCMENTGPEIPRPGQLAFAPMFSSAFSGVVDVDSARVVLLRLADSVVVKDTTVSIDGDSVDLTFPVVVLQEPALFVVTMDITGPGGAVLFQAGPDTVLATIGPTAGVVPTPVVIDYVGPGSDAATFAILTADTTLFSTEALQIVGEARDTGGSVTPAPVGWMSLDTTIATVGKGTGLAVAGSTPGTVGIVGALLTDVPPDTVFVTVRPVPSTLSVASGDAQSGAVNSALSSPIVFRLTGSGGLPVPGLDVSFVASAGVLSVLNAVTDASGNVSVSWTTPSTTGPVTLTATVDSFPTIQATATATVTAGAATDLTIVSGDGQRGTVTTPLIDSLVVLAIDAFGNPVPNTQVDWIVITNDGTVNPLPSSTDMTGRASVEWTLGSLIGLNEVQADLPGVPSPTRGVASDSAVGPSSQSAAPTVTFTATGNPGAPALLTKLSGDVQSATVATALPLPLVVEVTDLFGNPVAGVTVTFAVASGGGSVSPGSVPTDGAGRAQVTWTLGTSATASQAIDVTSSGLTTQSFTATGIPDAPSALAFTVDPSDALAGAVITPAVKVEILDQFANRVTQDNTTDVDMAITTGTGDPSAALSGTLTRTAAGGLVTFADLRIDSAATGYTLDAQIPSLAFATSAAFDVLSDRQVVWINTAGGNWSVGTNWSTGSPPGATDTALITTAGTYTVTLDLNPTLAAFTLGAASGIQTLDALNRDITLTGDATIGTNGRIDVTSGDLSVRGGNRLTVNGGGIRVGPGRTMVVGASGDGTILDFGGGIIGGPGTLFLNSGGQFDLNADLAVDSLVLNTFGHTVNGPGRFTIGPAANLVIDAAAVGVSINTVLEIQGRVPVIGTLNVVSDSVIVAVGASLEIGSASSVPASLAVANGLLNGGTIALTNGGFSPTASTLDLTSGSLTNVTGGQITSSFGAGGGSRTIDAELLNTGGTVSIDHPVTIGETGAVHTSSGTIDIATGATATFTGTSLTNGPGGIVQGGGTLDVASITFDNVGQINPGTSPGLLTVTGDVNAQVFSVINVELGGLAVGSGYDRIEVSGNFAQGGVINVLQFGGFVPTPGDQFAILTFASRSGTLTALNLPSISGLAFDTVVATGAGIDTLKVVVSAAGPANLNTWTTAANGNWSNPANWSNGVPTATDSAVIDLPGTYTVTIDQDITIADLDVGAISGQQTLNHAANTLTITNSAVVRTNGAYTLSGGTLTGAGNVSILGTLDWSGGGTMSGTGVTRLEAGGTGTIRNTVLDTRTFENAGTIVFTGGTGNAVTGNNGATLDNQVGGTLDIQTYPGWTVGVGAPPSFINAGTFQKSGGVTTTVVAWPFTNTGTIDLLTIGDIGFTGGGTFDGSVAAAASALLDLQTGSYTLNDGFTQTGAGALAITGATVTIPTAATATVAGLELTDGSGVLTGDGTLSIKGTLVWNSSGTMAGTGLTRLEAGGTGTIQSSVLDARTFENAGTLVVSGGGSATLTGSNGAVLDNQAVGTVDIQSFSGWVVGAGAPPSFTNAGRFQKSVGTGATNVAWPFANTGTVDLLTSGSIAFLGDFTHSTGAIVQGFGTLDLSSANTVSFDGQVNPGTSPGILQITGDVGFTSNTVVNIELDGTVVGTGYDRLFMNGNFLWNGTLAIDTNLFTPSPGDEFTIITYVTRNLNFANVTLPTIAGVTLDTIVATGAGVDTFKVVASAPAPPPFMWTGATDTDWFNSANWITAAVPTSTDSVLIQASAPNQPTVNSNTAVSIMTVEVGATVTLGPAATLTVDGNLDASGTVTGAGLLLKSGAGTSIAGTFGNLRTIDSITAVGTLTVTGNLDASGPGAGGPNVLFLNGFNSVVSGDLTVGPTGFGGVRFGGNDTMTVIGNALFSGGNSTTRYSAGVMRFGGNLVQSGASLEGYNPTGTHKTIFDGAGAQTVSMQNPTTATMQELEIANTGAGVTVLTNFQADLAVTVQPGATVTLNSGVTFTVSGDLDASGTITGAGTLLKNGAGSTIAGTISNLRTTDSITAVGALTITGNLTASGPGSVGGNVLSLNGFNADVAGDFTVGPTGFGGVRFAGNDTLTVAGNALFAGGGSPTDTRYAAGVFRLGGNLQQSGALCECYRAIGTHKLILDGSGAQSVTMENPTGSTMQELEISNTGAGVSLLTAVEVNASVDVQSSTLDLNGNTLTVNGTFRTTGTGIPTMLNAADVLNVVDADFAGGGTGGFLEAGTVFVSGNFTQSGGNAEAFHAGVAHDVVFTGASPHTISMLNAGIGSGVSLFAGLTFETSGTITLATDVYGHNNVASSSSFTPTVLGGGNSMVFRGLNVDGLVLDNVRFEYNTMPGFPAFGTFVQFDNVTFQNYAPPDTQLLVIGPGDATAFTMNTTVFSTTPVSPGLYIWAADSVADANTLTVDFSGSTPSDGTAFTGTDGGAVVNWTTPAPGTQITWGGASGDWNVSGNWVGGVVPGVSDTAIFPAGGYTTTVTTDQTVAGVVVNTGVTLLIDVSNSAVDDSLVVNGDVINAGTIQLQDNSSATGVPVLFVAAPNTLTNQVGATLVATGSDNSFRRVTAEISNLGLIDAAAEFRLNTATTIASSGFVTVPSSQNLTIVGGTFTNSTPGVIDGTGTLDVSGTTFNNNGIINPGTSPGILTLVGDLTNGATATLNAELNGTSAGSGYDRLNAPGSTIDFANSNLVVLDTGVAFTPAPGQTFTIVNFGTRVGDFGSITFPTVGDVQFDTVWNANSLNIVTSAPAPQTIAWNNAAGGNWSDGANWAGGSPPGAADTADITLAGTYTVNLDVSSAIASLELGGASGTQTLDAAFNLTATQNSNINTNGVLEVSSAVNFNGGGNLTLNGGTINIQPSQQLQFGTNDATSFAFSSGSITGPGILSTFGDAQIILLASLTLPTTSLILNTGGSVFALGPDTLTIGPSGQFTLSGQNAGQLVTVDAVVVNQGTMTAQTPFNLINDSLINEFGATVNISGLALDASLTVDRGFDNQGQLFLTNNASGLNATLTVTGGGDLTNAATGAISIQTGAGGGTRTIDGEISNQGNFTAFVDATIVSGTGTAHTNSGIWTVASNATLTYSAAGGTFTNSGIMDGGTVNFGVLGFVNTGTFGPAGFGGTGTATVSSATNDLSVGSLFLELQGNTAGLFDRVDLTGPTSIGSVLTIDTLNLFAPVASDRFPIMTAPTGTGFNFSSVTFPSITNIAFDTATITAAAADTFVVTAIASILAPTASWTGLGDGTSWNDPTNWNPAVVPSPLDSIIIDVGTSPTITVNTSPTVRWLQVIPSAGLVTLDITSQTMTVDSFAFLTPNTVLNLAGDISVGANGAFSSLGTVNWTSGTLLGTPSSGFVFDGTTTVSGAGQKILDGAVVSVGGTMTWTGGDIIGRTNSGLFVTTLGTLDLQADASFLDGDGTVSNLANQGRLTRTIGANVAQIDWAFQNVGQVDVASGTLGMRDLFSNEIDTVFVRAGATLALGGESDGVGTVIVESGGTVSAANTGCVAPASCTTPGNHAFGPVVNNGVMDVQTGSVWTQTSLTHNAGALLEGSGTFQLPASYTFDGDIDPGTVGTVGTLTVIGNLTLGASSVLTIDGTNAAGPAWDIVDVTGNFTRAGTVTFNNSGIPTGFQLGFLTMTGTDSGTFGSILPVGWTVTPPGGGTIFAVVP